jgi:hypothetical protein
MTSKRRSADYYRSDEGRKKKRAHNAARKGNQGEDGSLPAAVDPLPVPSPAAVPPDQTSPSSPSEPRFKESIIEYTRLIMSMTDGRKVSRDEALATLTRVVRQRSLDST